MKAEEIAEKARKSISKFCSLECKAYCCRKSYLILSAQETDIVSQGMRKELEDKKIIKKKGNGKYFLNLRGGCPSLRNNLCMIHNNSKRPAVCKQFPIFIKNKTIKLSPLCLAKQNDLFYPYVHELLKLGYKIHGNP